MPLKSFEVENYRAFVEPAKVELKELTLQFGYNNAGKSALARVLLRSSNWTADPARRPRRAHPAGCISHDVLTTFPTISIVNPNEAS